MLRGVRPADQHGEVAEIGEAAHRDRVPAPVLHRLQPGLEIEADGLLGRQGFQERRLADAGRAEDGEGGLVLGGREPFVGG